MQKFYRSILMASVMVVGLAACGDDLTIVDPAPAPPPPPPPPPPAPITTFTVSPTAITVAPGTETGVSATLLTAPGVTGTVAWSSSNSAVASLSNASDNGVTITAVSQGTAIITATATAGDQTATASIGVTVRPLTPAQISIQSITTANLGTPVNLGNVFGQIEVNMNFDPGEERVDSIAFFIGNVKAAQQTYTNGPAPAAGPISLSTNTAHYTKDWATGVATVRYPNGPATISAAVYRASGTPIATNQVQIVLNNADGWAAEIRNGDETAGSKGPSRSADNGSGVTYWGGPGEEGLATVTVFPVIYTAGRSVDQVTFRLGRIGFIGCPNTTMTAMPFRASYGYDADGATVDCSGNVGNPYEWTGGFGASRDNVIIVAALDNFSTPFVAPAPLIANTLVLGSTPDSLR
ncbi:MAG TPA: Ig-like domain-containing protein, partial [Gemmatimonadales bacterium]|nr:Ig-like domain-containing protein [Gemmatimonadales bacterium]